MNTTSNIGPNTVCRISEFERKKINKISLVSIRNSHNFFFKTSLQLTMEVTILLAVAAARMSETCSAALGLEPYIIAN